MTIVDVWWIWMVVVVKEAAIDGVAVVLGVTVKMTPGDLVGIVTEAVLNV